MPIYLDDVRCDGSEKNIDDCSKTVGISNHDCSRDEFAGVICNQVSSPGPEITQTSPSTDSEYSVYKCFISDI